MKRENLAKCAAAALCVGASFSIPAMGAENGTAWYLLGVKAGPGIAMTPPEGLFLQNDFYYFKGGSNLSRPLPLNGRLGAQIDAIAYINVLSALWVTPIQIGGARLAMTLSQPVGGPTIDAKLAATGAGPFGPFGISRNDSASFFGDPIVGSFLGWNSGTWRWQVGVSANVPIGYYDQAAISNISFHRWTADTYASATWSDPNIGFDISGSIGFTFNGMNPATNYRSGNEFHLEGSISKSITQELSLGLIGYHYEQISADSGAGAVLGPFEGRVSALGGTVGYTFKLGIIPISTRLKVFREFNSENRLRNVTSAFLSLAMPIWVPSAASAK